MANNILMPALSPTMEQGKLTKWLKKVGDEIKSGDILAEIETDKATMEVEAIDEGRLTAILVPEGTEEVPVNTPIGVIGVEGEEAPAVAAPAKDEAAVPAGAKPGSADVQSKPAAPGTNGKSHPGAGGADHALAGGAPVGAEPEIPQGTKMVTMTVREALRDAMAEEMRRDASVFIMGEEVAEYQGRLQGHPGVAAGIRREARDRYAHYRAWFCRCRRGCRHGGLRPVVEFMTFNFAMQAIDQIINSAAKTLYMSGGQMGSPIVFRGPNGAAARVAAQHSQDYTAWYSSVPGPEGRGALYGRRRQGAAEKRHPRPEPDRFPGK